jgi:membrane associated rhomboid family serine protease
MYSNKIISIFIVIIISTIYLLFTTGYFASLPCDGNFLSKVSSNFVHVDFIHLASNVVGLYFISELEPQIGSEKFLQLFVVLNIFLGLIESYFYKDKCSIGISGVLYGLIAYEMFKFKKIDYNIIIALIFLFLFSGDSKISHSGHLIGFLAGFLAVYIV